MRIYGRENNDLSTIAPYFPLEQVHIVADIEEIDNMIKFLLEVKKEQNNNAKVGKIVPTQMKDFFKLKLQRNEDVDIAVTVFEKVGGGSREVYRK